ncbi:Putative uncharacterized protein [Moritella viscosa]|nr:Putative uncharacterized protein [Moritella viscosa]
MIVFSGTSSIHREKRIAYKLDVVCAEREKKIAASKSFSLR